MQKRVGIPHYNPHKGFTIVELLIVIVIIGILAALVIVAYSGIQNRAHDTAVQSDLSTFAKKMEMAKIDRADGTYPVVTGLIATLGTSFSKGNYWVQDGNNLPYCRSTDGTGYALAARSKSGAAFYVSSTQTTATSYVWGWTSAAATTCPNILTGSYDNTWGFTVASGWNWAN